MRSLVLAALTVGLVMSSANVAAGTISRWERGTKIPPIPTLAGIAAGLGSDLDQFFAGIVGAGADIPESAEWPRVREALAGLTDAQLRNVCALLRVYRDGLRLAATTTPPPVD